MMDIRDLDGEVSDMMEIGDLDGAIQGGYWHGSHVVKKLFRSHFDSSCSKEADIGVDCMLSKNNSLRSRFDFLSLSICLAPFSSNALIHFQLFRFPRLSTFMRPCGIFVKLQRPNPRLA
jgi:hypothetical protein